MKTKIFLISFGLISIIAGIFGAIVNNNNYVVQSTGELIEVQVLQVPAHCNNSKGQKKIHFSYQSETGSNLDASINAKGRCGLINVGEKLMLKTNPERTIFLFEKENLWWRFIMARD